MKLQIGKLDRRITIESRTQTQGAYGELVNAWTTLATPWANVYSGGGREFVAAKQVNAEISIQFQIRWRGDVTDTMRVLWDGKYFDIVGFNTTDGFNRDGTGVYRKLILKGQTHCVSRWIEDSYAD